MTEKATLTMPIKRIVQCILILPIVYILNFPSVGQALEADELLVVANRNARGSIELARYYMRKRHVPDENLLKIFATDAESCSRQAYERQIAEPIRKRLKAYRLANRPRCIVLVKGVPLKIEAIPLTETQRTAIHELNTEEKRLDEQLRAANDESVKQRIKARLSVVGQDIRAFKFKHDTGASVDSELMLVLADDYDLSMWVPNPFFLGFRDKRLPVSQDDVIMVSRLDAPEVAIVHRMIDDAIAAEKSGLHGRAYFDARYKDPGDKRVTGYALYDKSIHRAARRIREKKLMPVVLEETQRLFQPGECPRAALYCGWYSLAHYVDAFEWVPGAIGYHIASAECRTLRAGPSQVWCKRMLEKGVAVTIGPVEEPYVQAFPLPEIFFGELAEGSLTVAECYLVSVPYLSWKMVLVGDPLYRPFGGR